MTDVHQVLVAASFGDAITNEALGLQRGIRQRFPGAVSDIFAYHRGPGMDAIRPLSEYESATRDGDTVLLFHSSIGEPSMSDFLAARHERTVVRYHNITPAEWFAPYDPAFARLLDLGRAQLAGLRDRTVLAIADSRFNQGELA
ncbi:MAG: hypothetical protein M3O87_00790, partial [Candidatus Dormibacteraeota bacterium]|nr:hypothetical protein [Candidatus Dormibacteraeota bacterium]